MNKNKGTYCLPSSNLYHLLGPHVADGLGVYNYEFCPNILHSSILHPPWGVMSSHSLGAKPEYRLMSFCWTVHMHWRVTAGSQTAVVWQAEVG